MGKSRHGRRLERQGKKLDETIHKFIAANNTTSPIPATLTAGLSSRDLKLVFELALLASSLDIAAIVVPMWMEQEEQSWMGWRDACSAIQAEIEDAQGRLTQEALDPHIAACTDLFVDLIHQAAAALGGNGADSEAGELLANPDLIFALAAQPGGHRVLAAIRDEMEDSATTPPFTETNNRGLSPWHVALRAGHLDNATFLAPSPGSDDLVARDYSGRSALMMALDAPDEDAFPKLMAHVLGLCTKPQISILLGLQSRQKRSILDEAAVRGHLPAVSALLDLPGFSPDHSTSPVSPLSYAVLGGHREVVHRLLPRMEPPLVPDPADGRTALYHAFQPRSSDSTRIVAAILEWDPLALTRESHEQLLAGLFSRMTSSAGPPPYTPPDEAVSAALVLLKRYAFPPLGPARIDLHAGLRVFNRRRLRLPSPLVSFCDPFSARARTRTRVPVWTPSTHVYFPLVVRDRIFAVLQIARTTTPDRMSYVSAPFTPLSTLPNELLCYLFAIIALQ